MRDRIISIDGVERTVALERDDAEISVKVDESRIPIRLVEVDDREILVELDGRQYSIPYLRQGDVIHFGFGGETWEAEIASPLQKKKREKEHSLGAPMPGSILRIHVEVGDEVSKGQALITLEAMKMEHQITAPYDGVIESIDCTEGAMVQPGVDLISVDPAESVS
ncbi:MAG: biotin/lipoyl-containing protein [Thermoanaerobaculia bacterium]|nr:biotin/lipoyl-containing protein [Thermoanaerobaculia bacterium]